MLCHVQPMSHQDDCMKGRMPIVRRYVPSSPLFIFPLEIWAFSPYQKFSTNCQCQKNYCTAWYVQLPASHYISGILLIGTPFG